MKLNLKALIGALSLLAVLAVVSGCGSSHHSSSGSSGPASGTSASAIDRAFIAAMIPHHRSAIEMAEVAAQRGTSTFVKDLAKDITTSQSAEITTMQAIDKRLAAAGAKAGDLGVSDHAMGMTMDTAALQTADPFDPAFLDMMLPHHEGALTMARIELAKGADPELKKLAQQIITAQEREITAMKAQGASSAGHATGDHM